MNLVDALLLAIIAAAMFYGWRTGVLRQVVAVSALMFAFMVAGQLYELLALWFSAAAQLAPPNFFQGLAYLFLLLLAAGIWFVGIRRIYPYTRLVDPEVGGLVWSLDRFGGLVLGTVLGLLLAIAVVGVVELLVYYRWPALVPAGPRDVIHAGVRDSRLVRTVLGEAPELADYLDHWVPGVAIAREGRILP